MTASPVRPATRILGWSVIGLVGGGATLVSIAIIAVGVLVADTLILDTPSVEAIYFTIVRQKGTVETPESNGVIYEVRDATGGSSDMWLPVTARVGGKVRLRVGRTRLFHLARPLEAPFLCPDSGSCE